MPKDPSTPVTPKKSIFPSSIGLGPSPRALSNLKTPKRHRSMSDKEIIFPSLKSSPRKRSASLFATLSPPDIRDLLTEEDKQMKDEFITSLKLGPSPEHVPQPEDKVRLEAVDHFTTERRYSPKLQVRPEDIIFYNSWPMPSRPSILCFKSDVNILGGTDIQPGHHGHFYSNSPLLRDLNLNLNGTLVYLCRQIVKCDDHVQFLGAFRLHISDVPLSANVWKPLSARLNGPLTSATDQKSEPDPPILVVVEFFRSGDNILTALRKKHDAITSAEREVKRSFEAEFPKPKRERSSPTKLTPRQYRSYQTSMTIKDQETQGFTSVAYAQSPMNPDRY